MRSFVAFSQQLVRTLSRREQEVFLAFQYRALQVVRERGIEALYEVFHTSPAELAEASATEPESTEEVLVAPVDLPGLGEPAFLPDFTGLPTVEEALDRFRNRNNPGESSLLTSDPSRPGTFSGVMKHNDIATEDTAPSPIPDSAVAAPQPYTVKKVDESAWEMDYKDVLRTLEESPLPHPLPSTPPEEEKAESDGPAPLPDQNPIPAGDDELQDSGTSTAEEADEAGTEETEAIVDTTTKAAGVADETVKAPASAPASPAAKLAEKLASAARQRQSAGPPARKATKH